MFPLTLTLSSQISFHKSWPSLLTALGLCQLHTADLQCADKYHIHYFKYSTLRVIRLSSLCRAYVPSPKPHSCLTLLYDLQLNLFLLLSVLPPPLLPLHPSSLPQSFPTLQPSSTSPPSLVRDLHLPPYDPQP